MFNFFNHDFCEVTRIGDKIKIDGNFGNSFKNYVRKFVGNDAKLNALFTRFSLMSIEFYSFFTPEIIHIFRSIVEAKRTFSINVLVAKKVLEYFENQGDLSDFKLDYKKIKENFDFRILDHQQPIFDTYERYKREYGYRGILLDAEPGTGKAQPLNCKVYTINGFRSIGTLKVGDTIIAPDGSFDKVLGVYKQGKKDTYKVTLVDGRTTKCCLEHLWKVKVENEEFITETKDIIEMMEKGLDVYIPLISGFRNNVNERIEEDFGIKLGLHLRKRKSFLGFETNFKKLPKAEYYSLKTKLDIFSNATGEDIDLGDDFTIPIRNDTKEVKYIKKMIFSIGASVESETIGDVVFITARFTDRWVKIKSINYNDNSECVCIRVGNKDSLYITDNFIVTHNTFSSLALAEASNCNNVFIICPLQTVNKVWVTSIQGGPGECVFKRPRDVFVLADGVPYNNEKYIVIHYEAIKKAIELFKNTKFINPAVIIDESHNLADIKSARTTEAINFVNSINTQNVFCLSGTPLKSSYRELVVLFNFITSNFEGFLQKRFLTFYKNPNENFFNFLQSRYQGISVKVKKDNIGLKPINTYTLKVKLKNGNDYKLTTIKDQMVKFVEKRKEELEEQMPYWETTYNVLYGKIKNDRSLDFKESEFIKYESLFNKIRDCKPGDLYFMADDLEYVNKFEKRISLHLHGEEKKLFKEAKTILKYPMLKIQGEALGIIVTGSRIKCHEDLASAINYSNVIDSSLKKTVVFSSYVNVCNKAFEKCIKEKYNPIPVYGEETKNLVGNVSEFSKNKKINPLVATYKSLSTGVPLIVANNVICLDLPFRLYMYDQAISRVWRLGQDEEVNVYIVKLDTGEEKNINGRTAEIMDFFKKEIENITGYSSNIDIDFDNEQEEAEDYTLVSEMVMSNECYDVIKSFFSEKYRISREDLGFDRSGNKFSLISEWLNGELEDGNKYEYDN